MNIVEMVEKRPSWLTSFDKSGVVISCRVRLARNLRRKSFPHWAAAGDRVKTCDELQAALRETGVISEPACFDMGELDQVEKEVLKERHLISHEFAEKGKGSALIVSGDERMAVMINEEDHLRMQFIDAGMDVSAGWSVLDSLDSELEKSVEYAFDQRLGYLTACPSNVGTGLRASVMMHLAGLKLVNEIEPVIKGLARIGLMVRGILGEGSEARGNMFQICSQTTMGEKEEKIIERVRNVAGEVTVHEKNARAKLMEKSGRFVLDQIIRALALLQNARLMSSGEALDLLSGLRFGIECGIIRNLGMDRVSELTLLTQPGHLQKLARRKLTVSARDETRADMLREALKDVKTSG